MRIVDSKFKHKIKFSLEFENRRKKIKKRKERKTKAHVLLGPFSLAGPPNLIPHGPPTRSCVRLSRRCRVGSGCQRHTPLRAPSRLAPSVVWAHTLSHSASGIAAHLPPLSLVPGAHCLASDSLCKLRLVSACSLLCGSAASGPSSSDHYQSRRRSTESARSQPKLVVRILAKIVGFGCHPGVLIGAPSHLSFIGS
jgi:hypothetical protein